MEVSTEILPLWGSCQINVIARTLQLHLQLERRKLHKNTTQALQFFVSLPQQSQAQAHLNHLLMIDPRQHDIHVIMQSMAALQSSAFFSGSPHLLSESVLASIPIQYNPVMSYLYQKIF